MFLVKFQLATAPIFYDHRYNNSFKSEELHTLLISSSGQMQLRTKIAFAHLTIPGKLNKTGDVAVWVRAKLLVFVDMT